MRSIKSFALAFLLLLPLLGAGPAGAVEVIRNGGFNAGLESWQKDRNLSPYWNPWTAGWVHLHPPTYGYTGTVLFQNLNVTQIAGVTFQFSMALAKGWEQEGHAVAVYLTYADNANPSQIHRVRIANPDNADTAVSPVPPETPVPTVLSASYAFPAEARKLVKIEIAKEDLGVFYADDVSLTAEGVAVGPLPVVSGVSPESGNYGTLVTVTGANFGTAGQLYIGGAAVATASWADTSITALVNEPTPGGKVVVIADFVRNNPTLSFNVTSPYFTVNLPTKEFTVIQGQRVDFPVKVDFFNNFTTQNGIGFFVPELGGNYTVTPSAIMSSGGVNVSVDTSGMAPGTYNLTVRSQQEGSEDRSAPFTLNVVTVTQIRFYEMDGSNPPQQVFLDAKTVTAQGKFGEGSGVEVEVHTSDGKILTRDEAGVILTSSNPNVVGAYPRYWGYDLHALLNGFANLLATAPDGAANFLPVTVNVPAESPRVTAFSLFPQNVSNKGTDDILFHVETNFDLVASGYSWGIDTSGMMNFTTDMSDLMPVLSDENRTLDLTFHVTNPPAPLGLAVVHMGGTGAVADLPLSTVNDASYSGLTFGARPLDPSIMIHDMLSVEFYAPGDLDTPAFARDIFDMGMMFGRPVRVGGIPPGTWKIRFTSGFGGGGFLPRWWPNATDGATAQALTFNAGQMVDDIYFFAPPAPTVSFSGGVKVGGDSSSYTPVQGAFVEEVWGSGHSTLTAADGSFTLPGFPAGDSFSVKITKDGMVPVYSADYVLDSDFTTQSPYALFPAGTLAAWSVDPGKGMVMGWVGGPDGRLAGARVTATNAWFGDTTYPVVYLVNENQWGGTETGADGVFAVLNVPDGTSINLSAQKPYWTFSGKGASVTVHGDSITQTGFPGTYEPPDEEIASALNSAIAALNAGDVNGFMAFVSADYLDRGETYAAFQAELAEEVASPDFEPITFTVNRTTVDNDLATVSVTFDGKGTDTLIFRNEAGEWKLYGNQLLFDARSSSGYMAESDQPNIYWVQTMVEDPSDIVTSVHVDGPGLPPGGVELNHDTQDHRWFSWGDTPETNAAANFGRVKPDLPLAFTLTIAYNDGTDKEEEQEVQVTRFMDDAYAKNPVPAQGASAATPLVFSWGPVPDCMYGVELWNEQGPLWEKRDLVLPSAAYDGPALAPGFYHWLAQCSDRDGNYSMRLLTFLKPDLAGDVDNDGEITGGDTVLGLPILTGGGQGQDFPALGDADRDGKIGQQDLLYILQQLSGRRQ